MKFLEDWLANTVGHANSCRVSDKAAVAGPQLGLTILGTDTDVGKTYVAQLIIRQLVSRGLAVGAYKPVASGLSPTGLSDAERLRDATGRPWPIERVCPQAFSAPLAPPIAAVREGSQVDDQLLRTGARWWQNHCDVLVVEGAGGAMSPLSDRSMVIDLAVDLAYPVLLVASHRLGMMNHVLLTLEAVARRGLTTLALIVNQVQPAADSSVILEESLACLLPFCGKIECYSLDYAGSTLSQVAQSASITRLVP